ncbi:UPF0175 family protein [Candidatus Woesearchaeota archaeon]|nr:UPF0175 family protein [Candidatus Woesearchaeota archaeon]
MKINRVSLTVPAEILEQSEKIAKEKAEDRSTTMRELLRLGIKQYMAERALALYAEGKISLEKAAEMAEISLWKILDLLKERKIPLHYSVDDIKKEIRDILSQNA